jgi:hypothetical protein
MNLLIKNGRFRPGQKHLGFVRGSRREEPKVHHAARDTDARLGLRIEEGGRP